jgi:hypothetical protein
MTPLLAPFLCSPLIERVRRELVVLQRAYLEDRVALDPRFRKLLTFIYVRRERK